MQVIKNSNMEKRNLTRQIQPTPKSGAADLRRYVIQSRAMSKNENI